MYCFHLLNYIILLFTILFYREILYIFVFPIICLLLETFSDDWVIQFCQVLILLIWTCFIWNFGPDSVLSKIKRENLILFQHKYCFFTLFSVFSQITVILFICSYLLSVLVIIYTIPIFIFIYHEQIVFNGQLRYIFIFPLSLTYLFLFFYLLSPFLYSFFPFLF